MQSSTRQYTPPELGAAPQRRRTRVAHADTHRHRSLRAPLLALSTSMHARLHVFGVPSFSRPERKQNYANPRKPACTRYFDYGSDFLGDEIRAVHASAPLTRVFYDFCGISSEKFSACALVRILGTKTALECKNGQLDPPPPHSKE